MITPLSLRPPIPRNKDSAPHAASPTAHIHRSAQRSSYIATRPYGRYMDSASFPPSTNTHIFHHITSRNLQSQSISTISTHIPWALVLQYHLAESTKSSYTPNSDICPPRSLPPAPIRNTRIREPCNMRLFARPRCDDAHDAHRESIHRILGIQIILCHFEHLPP